MLLLPVRLFLIFTGFKPGHNQEVLAVWFGPRKGGREQRHLQMQVFA